MWGILTQTQTTRRAGMPSNTRRLTGSSMSRARCSGVPRERSGVPSTATSPAPPITCTTSVTEITSVAGGSVALSRKWHPADIVEVTGPGTAMTGRSRRRACPAVFMAPDRSAASTTTVPVAKAAISLLRVRKRCRRGALPGHRGAPRRAPGAYRCGAAADRVAPAQRTRHRVRARVRRGARSAARRAQHGRQQAQVASDRTTPDALRHV